MDQADWVANVGDAWAREWRRTDRSFAPLTDLLLDRAVMLVTEPGHADGGARIVLDIGCGAGSTSLTLAGRLPGAQVTGVDISPALVAVAQGRSDGASNCRFVCADVAGWADPASRPDLLISRHGVMFFDDPIAAFSHLRAVSAPDARLLFSCFRSPAENEWATGIAGLLPAEAVPARLAPGAAGPFAFAEPAHVQSLLTAAGWRDIAHEAVDFAYVVGAGDNPVADALSFFSVIGPAASAIRSLEGETHAAFLERLRGWVEANLKDGVVAFRAAAWLWTARAGAASPEGAA
ncbi:MAG: methyltransferase [Sphingobium sp.]|nr:MAG: methyltransferase [Sphingobium sp.]